MIQSFTQWLESKQVQIAGPNPSPEAYALAKLFSSDKKMGVYKDGDYTMLPGEHPMGTCTNCAWFVVNRLRKGDVYGFDVEDNPDSFVAQDVGGHDFAVIDNRFIVDPWISLYTGQEDQIVYDMANPADQQKIKHLFGDKNKWVRFDKATKKIVKTNK